LPVILEVGESNPGDTAYYVWPQGDSRIYLIEKSTVEAVLGLVSEPQALTPASADPQASETADAPVP
jgi:hypothetical protein